MKNSVKGLSLNRADLGKFFGVALTTVDAWVREGCPYVKRAKGKGQQWEFDSAAVAEWLQDRAVTNKVGDIANIDIDEAKKRKMAAEASIAEINLRKLQGELVEFTEIEKAGIDSYSACRARLLNISPKVADRLTLISDAIEIKAILDREIYQALEELGHYEVAEDDGEQETE